MQGNLLDHQGPAALCRHRAAASGGGTGEVAAPELGEDAPLREDQVAEGRSQHVGGQNDTPKTDGATYFQIG